jgi:acetyl-CoA acetyltransferase
MQINRFCASGLEAVNLAAQKVASGWEDMVIAGGVESMSRVPIGSDGGAWAQDPETNFATGFVPQGIGADLIATLGGWDRDDVDRYALTSQQRAAAAQAEGRFDRSVLAVEDSLGLPVLERDEFIKPRTTLEGLGQLKVAFGELGALGFDAVALARYPHVERIRHVHTAGNSSGIVDGAAAVLIGSEAKGREMGPHAARPHRRDRAVGRRSDHHADRADAGDAQGAREGRPRHRRHRPVRGQRGVRRGADALHARDGRAARQGQRQRRRDRDGPSARRDRRDAARHLARRARAPSA